MFMSLLNIYHVKDRTLIQVAGYAAASVAIILVIGKFIAWQVTSSISLKASLVDSILDLMGSLFNIIIIRQALKPADNEHRFGHGKLEAIAGLAQSAFISGSAIWLLVEVANQLVEPIKLNHSFAGNVVMIISVILTTVLVLFQRYVVKKTKSVAIKADSVHYEGDLFSNIAVLISFNLASIYHFERLDVIVGGAIAIYILINAFMIAKKSLDILMDHELPEKDREKIVKIVLSHDNVLGFHDLRTRTTGRQDFVQLHLDLEPSLTLEEAHRISDSVESSIINAFPNAEVLIHQDPFGKYQAHPH